MADDIDYREMMDRLESSLQGGKAFSSGSEDFQGTNANVGLRSDMLQALARLSGGEGKPQAYGLDVTAGPVTVQHTQPLAPHAKASHGFSLDIDPRDVGMRLQAILERQGNGARSYGLGTGGDDWSLRAMYNPARRDLNISGGMQRRFAKGGIAIPSYDPMGSFTGIEGLDQEGRDPGLYERLADQLAGAGVAVGEPVRQATVGISDIPGSIGAYLSETAQKPDPSQRVAEDIRKVGGAMYEQAMSSPTEFAKTVGGFLPGIGEAMSAYDAKHLYGDLQKAEAEGDTKKADTLRQLYGLAAAGAIPGVGIAARVAGKVGHGAADLARELSPMGFYSHAAESAMGLPQAKGTPEQMAALLQKYGVKPDEMFTTGFADEAATAALRQKVASEFEPKIEAARKAMEGLEPGTKEFQQAERQFKNISSTMRAEMDRALVLGDEWKSRPSITSDELAQHFRENMPVVEEKIIGNPKGYPFKDWNEWKEQLSAAEKNGDMNRYNELSDMWKSFEAERGPRAPKYSQYTLPGGENYREVLLKAPRQETTTGDIAQKLFGRNMNELSLEEGRAVAEEMRRLGPSKQTDFTNSHWDDPNVLAHLRMSDRTGPNGEKILHIEEVQSDWGQKGKKEGFKLPGEPAGLSADETARFRELLNIPQIRRTPAQQAELDALNATGDRRLKAPPSAPYVTSTEGWTDLALKRALKEAAEGGYDKLVWTPGAEQAKRYDLSKQISRIGYQPETGTLYAVDTNGVRVPQLADKPYKPEELPGVIGKEAAEKLLSTDQDRLGYHLLVGNDLSLGGEGMRGYYDKILPKRLQEIVKKHDKDVKIGREMIETSPSMERLLSDNLRSYDKGIEVPSITITPKMRESILRGQTAFADGGVVSNSKENEMRDLYSLHRKYADGGLVRGYAGGGLYDDLKSVMPNDPQAFEGIPREDLERVMPNDPQSFEGIPKEELIRPMNRRSLRGAISMIDPEAQGATSPSWQGIRDALGSVGSGISDIYRTPEADLSAYMRVSERPMHRSITPSMLAASLDPEAQGASSPSLEGVGEVMHAMGEDPAALIGGMLPGIGNALAAADVAKLKDKIEILRAAGADEEASRLQRFLPLAAAGVVMPVGGGAAARGALRAAERAAVRDVGQELRASTRFPTGKSAIENPLLEQLTIGPAEMRTTPTFEHNMNLLAEYPGFAHLRGRSPEEQLAGYMEQARDNLNFLYENAPSVMRERSPAWYNGANNFSDALSERYGIPRQSSSAAIAALSPQMDWFKNASLAERVGDVIFGPAASTRMTPEMESFQRNSAALTNPANQAVFNSISGKRFSDLTDPLDQALWVRLYDEAHNPRNYRSITPEGKLGHFITNDDGSPAKVGWGSLNEIEKAVRAYTSGGDMNVISPMLGTKHKVRSFYNNIELPDDLRFGDVTADTHAVAAAQLRPLSGNTPAVAHNLASGLAKNKQPPNYVAEKSSAVTGVQGTYGANAEATRMAAADQGLIPRQMQSATWEPVRELFPAKWKNAKNVEAVDNIWREKDAGNLTAEQARNAIFELAGGFSEPAWAQRGSAPVDPRRGSTYR